MQFCIETFYTISLKYHINIYQKKNYYVPITIY